MGFLPGVHDHVTAKCARLSEGLVAERTFKRSLSGVYPGVDLERLFLRKPRAANVTDPRLHSRVALHVSLQITYKRNYLLSLPQIRTIENTILDAYHAL